MRWTSSRHARAGIVHRRAIGLATMQGLAMALGKPVCAMSTHEAIAPPAGEATIVDDAGRGEYYVSYYFDGREGRRPHWRSRAAG